MTISMLVDPRSAEPRRRRAGVDADRGAGFI
jgi:hypothetical protein